MLAIIASYHYMHFQGKIINKIWENDKKNLVSGQILAHVVQIQAAKLVWLRQSLFIMVIYHHVQYHKKLMIWSLENLVTDKPTDRQTNECDFIERCPANVQRQIKYFQNEAVTQRRSLKRCS